MGATAITMFVGVTFLALRMGAVPSTSVSVISEIARAAFPGSGPGTAGPMFVIGKNVKAGLYSKHPSLTDLDSNGDLKMSIDFRRVYATMISEWMGYKESKTILKGDYQPLGIFA